MTRNFTISRRGTARRSREVLEKVNENSRDESELESCDLSAWEDAARFDTEVQKEQERIKKVYEQQMKKLSCCQKLYLYIRRNFMNDIIFR